MLRPRRLRRNENIRNLVQETHIHLNSLIYPIFIEEDIQTKIEISTLPNLFRIPEHALEQEILELHALGIQCVMPFGISHHKSHDGSDTWHKNGLLFRMIRKIKTICPEMIVIPDICFCEYTDHGHCGVIANGDVDNDLTVTNLIKQSLNAAEAGADFLAPSSMMDGQVQAIRTGLDAMGYTHVGIMAHSIKFASSFYGPFRVAVDTQLNGNRKSYQADYSNGKYALKEAELDELEGADILMVKPGTPYLDIVSHLSQKTNLPIAAYQVGGEYAAIKFAALAGALDEKQAVLETLIGFKRAGATMIISYYAKEFAQWLNNKES